MISNALASAPAGVLGSGTVDARPHSCASVRTLPVHVVAVVPPTAMSTAPSTAIASVALGALSGLAAAQGTGVPFTGPARRFRDLAAPTGTGVPARLQAQIRYESDPRITTTHNGISTLGIHCPGRPTS